MKILVAFIFIFVARAYAETSLHSLIDNELGIAETNLHVEKTSIDPKGNREVLTFFKGFDSKILWQVEHITKHRNVSSRIQRFKDGSRLSENFSSTGKVESRIKIDNNGKTTVENF